MCTMSGADYVLLYIGYRFSTIGISICHVMIDWCTPATVIQKPKHAFNLFYSETGIFQQNVVIAWPLMAKESSHQYKQTRLSKSDRK